MAAALRRRGALPPRLIRAPRPSTQRKVLFVPRRRLARRPRFLRGGYRDATVSPEPSSNPPGRGGFRDSSDYTRCTSTAYSRGAYREGHEASPTFKKNLKFAERDPSDGERNEDESEPFFFGSVETTEGAVVCGGCSAFVDFGNWTCVKYRLAPLPLASNPDV